MGTLITTVCESCGYRKDNMALFGGMIGFLDTCMIPYYCESCNTLFEGNMLEDDIFCPECGKDNTFSYEDARTGFKEDKTLFSWFVHKFEREVKLNEEGNLCPKCANFTLKFEDVGNWD